MFVGGRFAPWVSPQIHRRVKLVWQPRRSGNEAVVNVWALDHQRVLGDLDRHVLNDALPRAGVLVNRDGEEV